MGLPIIGGLISLAENWIAGRAKKQEKLLDVQLAQIEAQGKSDDYDIEALRQQGTSWKDEWLLLVLTMPFLMAFFPQTQEWARNGWAYIAEAPYWYQFAFCGVIFAVYGLRWYVRDNNFKFTQQLVESKKEMQKP